jgi:hypothetical protein
MCDSFSEWRRWTKTSVDLCFWEARFTRILRVSIRLAESILFGQEGIILLHGYGEAAQDRESHWALDGDLLR